MENLRFISFLEASLIAVMVLVIIFINTKKYKYKYMLEEKIYRTLICLNIFMLLLDIVRSYVNTIDSEYMRMMNLSFSFIMTALTPLIPMTWSAYVDFKIFLDLERLKRRIVYLSIPVFFNIILVLVGLIGVSQISAFSVDASNVYRREELYIVVVLINYAYLLYSSVLLIKNKTLLDSREYKALKMFIIPPVIGAFLQAMIYGIKIVWFSMTISLVIIFIDVQNKLLYIDSLTGLYNRRNLEKYLKSTLIQKKKNSTVCGILLDVNDFKYINDTFGHIEGDSALVSISNVIKNTFDECDFIARYAGDEFVIVTEDKSLKELHTKISKLEENISYYNNTSNKPYEIVFSKGFHLFLNDKSLTEESFIKKIDSLMYIDKTVYKRKGSRVNFKGVTETE